MSMQRLTLFLLPLNEQELLVADREVGVEVREFLIDGVKLDSNSSLNTLRGEV